MLLPGFSVPLLALMPPPPGLEEEGRPEDDQNLPASTGRGLLLLSTSQEPSSSCSHPHPVPLAPFSALPLMRLGLPSRHTVTDVGLAAICRLVGLLELDLTDYRHISDEGLRPLPQLCR